MRSRSFCTIDDERPTLVYFIYVGFDGGDTSAMSTFDDETRKRQTLSEIARALAVPVEAFLGPAVTGGESPSTVEQEEELLHLFRQVRSEQARRRCLSFVRTLVKRSPSD